MLLSESKSGDQLEIVRIWGSGAIRQRLLDMGITRGTKLNVERYAPLKDPLQVTVKGYSLALRVSEGELIEVVKV